LPLIRHPCRGLCFALKEAWKRPMAWLRMGRRLLGPFGGLVVERKSPDARFCHAMGIEKRGQKGPAFLVFVILVSFPDRPKALFSKQKGLNAQAQGLPLLVHFYDNGVCSQLGSCSTLNCPPVRFATLTSAGSLSPVKRSTIFALPET
jgi:hypothetical protein